MTERVGGSLIENDGGEHRGRVTPTRQSCDVIEGKEKEREREILSRGIHSLLGKSSTRVSLKGTRNRLPRSNRKRDPGR